MRSGDSEDFDDEYGSADVMRDFVDAENREIARRHADLQRKNQVDQQHRQLCLVFYQEFSGSPLINFNSNPSCLDSSQLSHDLWEAASAGRADTTRLLLASGADPNLLVAINVVLPFVPCLEKDWIDVDLHLPGGGQLQRPHRGGRRPGGAQGHRRQRHRIWRLDGAHVGGMVGVS